MPAIGFRIARASAFAFLLELCGIGQLFGWRDRINRLQRRDSLRTLAYRAQLKVGGVISLALGAGKTIASVVRNRRRLQRMAKDLACRCRSSSVARR